MTFTVTYRGRDGAMHEEAVAAANRAECMAECKRRGIVPTSIREGRSGKSAVSPNGRTPSTSAPLIRIGAIIVAVILVMAGVWWWLAARGDRGATTPPADAQERVPPVKKVNTTKPAPPAQSPAKPKHAPPVTTNTNTPAAKADPLPPWNDSFTTNREMRIKFSVLASAQTNDSGVVTERYRLPNGKFWRRQIDPPPIFDNPSDNAIAMALGDRSGAPIPPYPGLYDANLDEEFVKSLLNPIVINEDDKPWLVAMKTAVKEAREEIARQLKAGDTRSVGEMLRDHVQENNRRADLQGDALRGYQKVLETDGEEAATEYLQKVNEALERFGVAPIKATANKRERK